MKQRTDFVDFHSNVSGHALVLGGTGAIGLAVLQALVENGVKKISFTYSKSAERAQTIATRLVRQGAEVVFGNPDLSSDVLMADFLSKTSSEFNEEISLMVNAVGVSPNIPLPEQTLEGKDGWRNVFETNVYGAFVSARAVAERMKKRGVRGSIVLVTSTNGINSFAPYSIAYDCSKGAMIPMVSDLALAYAPHGIRVNGVAPGWVDTGMNDSLPPGEYERERKKIWLGQQFLPVEDVVRPILFLLGSGARSITGQNLVVDGGYR